MSIKHAKQVKTAIYTEKEPPVMQARLLSLPKLKHLWLKPVSSPVFRLWNHASAHRKKREIFQICQ